MADSVDPFAARPMDEVKKELHGRAKHNRNPFLYTVYDEVAPVIDRLELRRPRRLGQSLQLVGRAP